MDPVRIIKGSEYGTGRVLYLDPDQEFDLWINHYDKHLKRLYEVFQIACSKNSVRWNRHIDFLTFREYVYENSSKYLTPWL
jgi:hypothetical protein